METFRNNLIQFFARFLLGATKYSLPHLKAKRHACVLCISKKAFVNLHDKILQGYFLIILIFQIDEGVQNVSHNGVMLASINVMSPKIQPLNLKG